VLVLQLVVSGILLGGVYALISVGLTLIFGVMRVINFAHGEFLMLSLYASFWLFELGKIHPYTGLAIVPPVAFLVGLGVFVVLIAPAMRRGPSSQLFVTMGLSMLLTNLALFFWKADFRSIALPLSGENLIVGPLFVPVAALVAFGVAIVATLALWALLAFTHVGRAIRATAQDPATAELMGVNVRLVNALTFALGTALVALAGPVLSPVYPVFPMVGLHMVGIAFVVVVLGGLGSVPGAWIGGLVMGVVDAFAGFYFPTAFKDTIFFVVFLAMLVWRPSGILGVRGAEEVGLK
jgi:branched-chain amino acid transport system permease protein